MKSKYNSAATFFLILTLIFAVLIGTADAQPGGRLLVLRSANFGWNLGFNLEIDGRPVGNPPRATTSTDGCQLGRMS